MTLLRTVLSLALILPLWASIAHAAVFNPETFMLKNGMQVVVVPNHRVPVVTHMVWYKVGAADEQPGKSGISHLLEHLMFKGTNTVAPGEFSKTVARNGGQENAFTSQDYTGYYQSVAKDRLELVMRMEADRMTNLILTAEQIDPEREVVLEERRQRIENDPGAILSEQAQAALYLNHPYGRPVIGWAHELKALTVDDILAYYRLWYAPNNAILVIAGDVTGDEVRPLAEKYYGVIPPAPTPARLRPTEPPQQAPRMVSLEDARVRQPVWGRSYLAPSYGNDPDGQAYALEVLEELLGSSATSRLYRALVVDQGIAVSAGAYYSPRGLDSGTFGFYASPRPGFDLEDLELAMDAEIAKLLQAGVTEDEVARVKERLIAQAIYARDSLSTGARVLGSSLASGQTVADVEAWPDRIEAVTAEAVTAAARAVLVGNRSVTSYLRPAPTEQASKGAPK